MICKQNILWNPFWCTWWFLIPLFIVFAFMNTGCSIKRMAINKIGDALSGGGTSFAMDNDPELVKSAGHDGFSGRNLSIFNPRRK